MQFVTLFLHCVLDYIMYFGGESREEEEQQRRRCEVGYNPVLCTWHRDLSVDPQPHATRDAAMQLEI